MQERIARFRLNRSHEDVQSIDPAVTSRTAYKRRRVECLRSFLRIICPLALALGVQLVQLGCERGAPVETETPSQPADILTRLRSLPGIKVTEVSPLYGFPRAFEIDLLQPVDHANPNGPTFSQRIYLSHVDQTMPMVFAPSGYGASLQSVQEIAGILRTNHLSVAHRFFVDAEPSPLDWRLLNIRQAADDHHRIVVLFKSIYKNQWISSGVSKGGMTCLFHKRYYPDDVDATVAYVAPILVGAPDMRFPARLATIGDEASRNKIKAFQRMCLVNRDSLISRMPGWFSKKGLTLGENAELVFEEVVASYDWTFWQYHTRGSADIPGEGSSLDEVFLHLAEVARMERGSDEQRNYYRPYTYQAYTELGYPARDYDHLKDLLKSNPDSLDHELLSTLQAATTYDPHTMADIKTWLQTSGHHIIYLYGSIDPWTAGAIEAIGGTNALKVIQPGGDHRIKIANLDDRDVVIRKLEEWLKLEINLSQMRQFPETPEKIINWELRAH